MNNLSIHNPKKSDPIEDRYESTLHLYGDPEKISLIFKKFKNNGVVIDEKWQYDCIIQGKEVDELNFMIAPIEKGYCFSSIISFFQKLSYPNVLIFFEYQEVISSNYTSYDGIYVFKNGEIREFAYNSSEMKIVSSLVEDEQISDIACFIDKFKLSQPLETYLLQHYFL